MVLFNFYQGRHLLWLLLNILLQNKFNISVKQSLACKMDWHVIVMSHESGSTYQMNTRMDTNTRHWIGSNEPVLTPILQSCLSFCSEGGWFMCSPLRSILTCLIGDPTELEPTQSCSLRPSLSWPLPTWVSQKPPKPVQICSLCSKCIY